jgi:hypothetical protein
MRLCDMCMEEAADERVSHEGTYIWVGEVCFWAMMGD